MAGNNITIDVTINGQTIAVQVPPVVGIELTPNPIPYVQQTSDWLSSIDPTRILNKPTIVNPPAPIDANDFQVSNGLGAWVTKTLAQVKGILGLGTGAYNNIPAIGNASLSETVVGSDTRLTDSRTPSAHASTHVTTDVIQSATSSQDGLATSAQILKLDGIESGSQVNVNSDWNSLSGDSFIFNKPALGTGAFKNIPTVGDASSTQLVYGTDSRLTDTRTPKDLTGAVTSIGTATTLNSNLNDLNDVVAPTPNLDDILKFNGVQWINGSITSPTSAGSGVSFFYSGALSGISTYELISKSPDADPEQDETITVNNETLPFEAYSTDVALGRTSIDAGIWTFNTYAYAVPTDGISSLIFDVYKRASGGTETLLFSVESQDINNSSVELLITSTVQPAFTILVTDLLVVKLSAKTTNTNPTVIHFVHSGTVHYSNILTPLITLHNDLAGLQGGSQTERYHVSLSEAGVIANTSGTNSGDNATNSQYSGLATSKQDTLVSGLNIKTINSESLLGSTNILLQTPLGYTPEDVSNKENSVINTSTTKYPTVNLLRSGLSAKQDALGFTPENVANKVTSISGSSTDTQYPSAKLVYDQLAGKQPTGSYLVASDITGKEDSSNKVTSISGASTDAQYPSAKLVYDQLAGKQPTGSYLTSLNGAVLTDQTTPQTVSNGRLTFSDGIKLGTNPNVGTFEEGKVYYDSINKTVVAMIDNGITMQLGQEELVLCYNNTGVDIPNGSVVRQTGANGDMPTIALAKADSINTYLDIGMTTQLIPNGTSGFVTTRGIVHDVDTSLFTSGQDLYLSESVAGGVTSTAPADSSHFVVKIGTALIISATTGSIYVRQVLNNRLTDLSDVAIDTPVVDQVLTYNGTQWINGNQRSISAGAGVAFYLDSTKIIPIGSPAQGTGLESLSKSPSDPLEEIENVTVNNSTALIDRYMYNTALGRTKIDSGAWVFNTFAYVNNNNGVSYIPTSVYKVVAGSGTVTITGTGTSRTAIVTGGTPFVVGDANGDITLSGHVQTTNSVLRITGFTSSSQVTVETLSTYVNETSSAYSTHHVLFTDTTTEINFEVVGLTTTKTIQPEFTIGLTDKLAVAYFARTAANANRTLYLYHGGTDHYTYIETPLGVLHNELSGLQGGGTDEKYHLDLTKYNVVQNTSGINTGNQDLTKQNTVIKSADYTMTLTDQVVVFTSSANYTLLPATGTTHTVRVIARNCIVTFIPDGTDVIRGETIQQMSGYSDLILTDTQNGFWE